MPTSSSTDPYTDTIWLLVALPEDKPPELLAGLVDEHDARMHVKWNEVALKRRVIAIPYSIMLPVLVKNALEALDDE